MKVLIIDDMQSNLDLFEDILGCEFDIFSYTDSQKALKALSTIRPELVLLDCVMPELSGHEVLVRIKEKYPMLPVIMISGFRNESNLLKAMDLQTDDFIYKPIDTEQLKARINNKILKSKHVYEEIEATIELDECDDIVFNDYEEKITIEDNVYKLKTREYILFKYLFRKKNQLVTREEIFENIWKQTQVSPATLDTHLCQLRKRLQNHGNRIITRRNSGFLYSTELTQ
jgi:DNA-binding response OmpR family regulator